MGMSHFHESGREPGVERGGMNCNREWEPADTASSRLLPVVAVAGGPSPILRERHHLFLYRAIGGCIVARR